jgi:hypothetical protein
MKVARRRRVDGWERCDQRRAGVASGTHCALPKCGLSMAVASSAWVSMVVVVSGMSVVA